MSNFVRSFAPPPDRAARAAQDLAVLESRVDQVDALILAALVRYGTGPVNPDVLLDIRLALHPPALRPAVPVIPGPDGPRR